MERYRYLGISETDLIEPETPEIEANNALELTPDEISAVMARTDYLLSKIPTPDIEDETLQDSASITINSPSTVFSLEDEQMATRAYKRMKINKSNLESKNLIDEVQELDENLNDIKNLITRNNTRLVVSVAKTFPRNNIPLADLVQEGNIGLMIAVEKFDPKFETKFSTYATYWIRQSIMRALGNKSSLIRLPMHVQDKMRKINRVENSWELEEKKPTPQDIESITGISQHTQRTIFEARKLNRVSSIDQPVRKDYESENTLKDTVQDPDSTKPLEESIAKISYEQLLESIKRSSLTEQEYEVIMHRYGFNGEPMTFEQVGNVIGVTRERVRQVEKNAIAKLKNDPVIKSFIS